MMRWLSAVALFWVTTMVMAETVKEVEANAMHGDYQAQRNLAYGYAAWPFAGQQKDPVKACSWYLLVLRSDSPKLHIGDVGNVTTYCNPLDPDRRLRAEREANKLQRDIYKR